MDWIDEFHRAPLGLPDPPSSSVLRTTTDARRFPSLSRCRDAAFENVEELWGVVVFDVVDVPES